MTSPTSSASASRPSGKLRAPNASRTAAGEVPVRAATISARPSAASVWVVVGQTLLTRMPSLQYLAGQAVGERDLGRLRRHVLELAGLALFAAHRGDQHDAAVLPRPHVGQYRLQHADRRQHVQVVGEGSSRRGSRRRMDREPTRPPPRRGAAPSRRPVGGSSRPLPSRRRCETRMSIRPKRSTVRCTARSTSASRRTSASAISTSPPAARKLAAARSRASRPRARRATRAPSAT